MRLSLLVLAAGLAAMPAAAANYDNCTSYLIGGWILETDGDPVTVVFGGGGQLKMVRREGEEWAKWTATDGAGMKTCDVSIVSENGHDEHVTFDILDERTISAKNKTYRREGTATEQAYEDGKKAGQAFDNATCPTYFVGAWTSLNSKKTRVTRAVFGADGAYTVTEGKVGKALDDPLNGTWRAAAGSKPGWCTVTLAAEGRQSDAEVEVLGADSFADRKSEMTFTRE